MSKHDVAQQYVSETLIKAEEEEQRSQALRTEAEQLMAQAQSKMEESEQHQVASQLLRTMFAAATHHTESPGVTDTPAPDTSALNGVAPATAGASAPVTAIITEAAPATAGSSAPATAAPASPVQGTGQVTGKRGRKPKDVSAQQPITGTGRRRGRPRNADRLPLPESSPPPVATALVQINSTPPGITDDMSGAAQYTAIIHELIKAEAEGKPTITSTELGERLTRLGTFGKLSGRNLAPHALRIPHVQFEKTDKGRWSYAHEPYKQEFLAKLAAATEEAVGGAGGTPGQNTTGDTSFAGAETGLVAGIHSMASDAQKREAPALHVAIIEALAKAAAEGKALGDDELATRLSALAKFGTLTGLVLSSLANQIPGVTVHNGQWTYTAPAVSQEVAATLQA